MNTPKMLGGLLVVQVALGAVAWWPHDAAVSTPKLLVEGGGNAITKISIVGSAKDAKPVQLDAKDGKWSLTSADGFPVDADKVSEVLDGLAAIKLADPVASQASSYEQLKVSDTTFDKKVTFTANGAEHTLIVGAAASKSIYLRVDGGTDVYQAKGLSAWSFKDSARGFLPTNYVDLDKDKLSTLSLTNATGTIELIKQGDTWSIGGPTPGPALPDKVSDLLDKATKVRLADTVGTVAKPEFGLATPTVRVTWTQVDGDTKSQGAYSVGALADGKYYVQTDGSAFVVSSPSYRIDDLIKATAGALAAPAGAPATDATPSPGDGMQPGFDPTEAMQPK